MSQTPKHLSLQSFRPYQNEALDFLYEHDSAFLLLRMGGGKTIITLSCAIELLRDGHVSNVLVVAPKAVALNTWATEYLNWEHTLDVDLGICWGTPSQRQDVLDRNHDFTVVTYDNLQWFAKANAGKVWDLVVLDEVTRFNNGGKRFKALLPVLEASTIRWGLTGSLAVNNLEHIFYPCRAVDLGAALGRRITPFRQEHFWKAEFGWEAKAGQGTIVANKIKHLCFQPDPSVYQSQLPEIVYQEHSFDLSTKCDGIYESLQNEFVAEHQGETIDVASAGALVGKLQQVTSGFMYSEEGEPIHIDSTRIDLLQELIAEAQEPVLVWYWFNSTGNLLRSLGYVDLIDNLADWNAGRVPVAICHPASGGHGLNAQAGGSRMIWYEHTYSEEMRQQAIARLHRQGQSRTVYCHDITATRKGMMTIDHVILQAQQTKRSLAEVVASALKKGPDGLEDRQGQDASHQSEGEMA